MFKVLFLCLIMYFLYVLIIFNLFFISFVQANDVCLNNQQRLDTMSNWGIVSRIVDGDTLHLKDGRKIRLLGINTPERAYHGKASQPFSKKATQLVKHLLRHNKRVGLSYDQQKKDRYKRILAYVNLEDGRSIEQILLAKGFAQSLVIPPNDARVGCYRRIENKARLENLGIWQLPKNQWIDAKLLSKKAKGLYFIRGTILDYSESRNSIYLKLSHQLSIRIAKKDKIYFPDINFNTILGQLVSVRGWVNTYKGHQSISIRTAYDLKI